MKRRIFLRDLLRGINLGLAGWLAMQPCPFSAAYGALVEQPELDKKAFENLKEIYKETKELGKYGNEDFINREFYLDLDKNPVNSEEHVNILIYDAAGREKMVLQVTYFEPLNRFVKHAKEIRQIICFIKGDKLEIQKCDYSQSQTKSLLPEILKEIRHEKELLKQIDR